MQYQVNIQISQAGVQQIFANGQFITFVKNSTQNPLASGNLPVAWLSFAPFMNNQVTWVENYYIYASMTQIQSGATIMTTSQTPATAQLGPIYNFSGGTFSTSGQQGAATTFNVLNNYGSSLTFGLAQQATVNGTSVMAPLNATAIGNGQPGTFTPIETVSIYLSSYSNNGVVISQVASTALPVNLTSQQSVANIGFNTSNNTFYLVSQTGMNASLSLADVATNNVPTFSAYPSQQPQRQLNR